ncbi:outer membrane beta-barrel protein [Niabella drilacis]|uniref:Outer membrane protein beta-barrel domain-containing protein n=1 Tax=Niabella drilacis (strain DSM 25811 / CCM 8410 / CCUG 62505 / LMG 26954 / E90) TaxID=1285928 RepID=A0A1G6W729_NIADE|nr:outer membrane beta-barrel protein [Niabella drilacis]SDD61662.1 Outer membrane protein beta-barrel domain-containing protein [Niabella drilacis]
MQTKNIKTAALLLCFFLFLNRTAYSQTRMGIQAGLNAAYVQVTNGTSAVSGSIFRPGIGLLADIPLVSKIYLRPALAYSRKGFRQDHSWFAGRDNQLRVAASYIEMPLPLVYKQELGPGKLLVGAGPYIAYGTGGRWSTKYDITEEDIVLSENHGRVIFKKDITEGGFNNYLYGQPWDYGASFLLGYEFLKRFWLQAGFQLGTADLKRMYSGKERDGTLQNREGSISVGVYF